MEMYEKDAIKIAESYAVAMRTRNGKVNATKLEYSLVCLYARKREKLSIGRKCNRGILATLAEEFLRLTSFRWIQPRPSIRVRCPCRF